MGFIQKILNSMSLRSQYPEQRFITPETPEDNKALRDIVQEIRGTGAEDLMRVARNINMLQNLLSENDPKELGKKIKHLSNTLGVFSEKSKSMLLENLSELIKREDIPNSVNIVKCFKLKPEETTPVILRSLTVLTVKGTRSSLKVVKEALGEFKNKNHNSIRNDLNLTQDDLLKLKPLILKSITDQLEKSNLDKEKLSNTEIVDYVITSSKILNFNDDDFKVINKKLCPSVINLIKNDLKSNDGIKNLSKSTLIIYSLRFSYEEIKPVLPDILRLLGEFIQKGKLDSAHRIITLLKLSDTTEFKNEFKEWIINFTKEDKLTEASALATRFEIQKSELASIMKEYLNRKH